MANKKDKKDALIGRRVTIHSDVPANPGATGTITEGPDKLGAYTVQFTGHDGVGTCEEHYPMGDFTVLPEGTPAGPSRLVEEDPYLVAFSPTNPRRRKGLDVESLSSLAASIKAQGLAQPILVRPLPGSRTEETFRTREEGRPLPAYELVCGERRLRACRLADLPTMPMLVRELSDQEALELQLVENIQREDLDPMEEAEGFDRMRRELGYSVEQIAERIAKGKGKDYVYKTMKLLELTPESREAMYDGHLGRSTGLLVARYPAAQQADVVEFIKDLARGGEPAPFRLVAPQVFRRFNLALKAAVWLIGDETLVPDAGACTTCPKRTGAHGDLFGDEADDEDSCTDPDCFEGKRQAHVVRVKADAEKQGLKVIDGDAAKEAIPTAWSGWVRGYSRLTDVAYTETGNDGVERQVTFEDALRSLGKKAPKPQVLINPHTAEAIKVIPESLADELVEKHEDKEDGKRTPGSRSTLPAKEEDARPEEEKALDDHAVGRAVVVRMFDAIRARDRTDADMLVIAKALFTLALINGDLPRLELYQGWSDEFEGKHEEDVVRHILAKLDALPPAEVAALLTMAAVETLMGSWHVTRPQEVALAQAYGVDILAVRDKVAEDLTRQHGGDDEDPDAGGGELSDDDAPTASAGDGEPEPVVGARVRIKDGLRGANGKFRKISGREGELVEQSDCGVWMFRSDGGKDKARVERDEFVVLALPGPQTMDDEQAQSVAGRIDPAAAWPFPIDRQGAAA
ncbi:MAG TPA: ParB/RepB/Spo0J family partition protein [Solimonas sp.]